MKKKDNYIYNDYINKENYNESDYKEKLNYIDNVKIKNNNIIDVDKKVAYNEKEINYQEYDLNKLGNYGLSTNMEYALYLYIVYCEKFGYDPTKIVSYIIKNSINNTNKLFNADKDFKKWIIINYGLNKAYIKHLQKIGIDISSDDVIELYKGKLDTISPEKEIISPYAETLKKQNSVIYKINNEIYKIINGSFEKIESGKTFIIQNPYSVVDLLYLLGTIGNTDNKIVISFYGSLNDINRKKHFSTVSEILKFLGINNPEDVQIKYDEQDGMFLYSCIMNARSIKKNIDYEELLTIKAKKILGDNYNPNSRKGR